MSYRNREKKAYLILTSFWQAYLSRFRLLPNQATLYSNREGSIEAQLDQTGQLSSDGKSMHNALDNLDIMTQIVAVGICTQNENPQNCELIRK